MALYQDDDGNLYWTEQIRAVLRPPTDPARMAFGSQPRLIHPHRLERLSRSSLIVGLSALLLGALALAARLWDWEWLSGLAGGLAIMVCGVGPWLVLKGGGGQRTIPVTPLRAVRRPPIGTVLMEVTTRLGFTIFIIKAAIDMLRHHPGNLWAQGFAVVSAAVTLLLVGTVIWRLSILLRPAQPA